MAATDQVTLQVLNPRGVLHMDPPTGLFAPRPADLNGKKIALLAEKPDAELFFDFMEEMLKERFPSCTVLRMPSSANPNVPDNTEEVARVADCWLQGIKSSGSSMGDYEAKLEKLGCPGVTYTADGLLAQRIRLADVNGVPTVRIVCIPGEAYFGYGALPENMRPIVAGVFDETVRELTRPLTEEEKNPKPFTYDYSPKTFTGATYTEVNEQYQQYAVDEQMGDGIALVPPSPEAVKWMLTGTTRDPQEELGRMVPYHGVATIEKVAINAVMAGAKPEYLPVIIATVEAICDRSFNLYHIQTGTLNSRVLIWVNGPIAKEIGMNAGQGFLGYGFRANSSIGRAVSLSMINIGWSLRDAELGMLGQPARYCNLTFAENEAESPWESFAVERGYAPEDSTVTVDECISTDRLGPGGGMTTLTLEQNMDMLARMITGVVPFPFGPGGSGDAAMFGNVGILEMIDRRYSELAIYPAFACQLARAGYSRQALAQALCDKHRIPWESLSEKHQAEMKAAAAAGTLPGLTLDDCKPGGMVPTFNPRHIAIIVAGGMVGQCMSFNGGGSTVINADNPGAPRYDFMTRKIHGAALTKAGR